MCYGQPTEMLELSRARLTAEQWEKFEADFQHFCAYSGLQGACEGETRTDDERSQTRAKALAFTWAKWAYLCGNGL